MGQNYWLGLNDISVIDKKNQNLIILYHYLYRFAGKPEEASKNLQRLRGSTEAAIQEELDGLKAIVAREFKVEPMIKDLWATRGNVKALGICVFLAMLLQLSGIDVLLFYMEELLVKVGTKISASDGTIIMGVVQVCSRLN